MDTKQADAIAQAILLPGLDAQEQIRKKRERDAVEQLRKRRIALITLAGCAIGAIAAWLCGIRIAEGVIYGGLTASALGWLFSARPSAG